MMFNNLIFYEYNVNVYVLWQSIIILVIYPEVLTGYYVWNKSKKDINIVLPNTSSANKSCLLDVTMIIEQKCKLC